MLAVLTCMSLAVAPPQIDRDSFGVPHIVASSPEEAYFEAGYAVAQDRLWQMENSRRVALGRMAEVFGPQFAASDREILKTGYTDYELNLQFQGLTEPERRDVQRYADGVNAWIDEATAHDNLPPGYASNGFKPTPWTVTDTMAITIRLFRIFGTGGAGQLRNMAVLGYLDGQSKVKNRKLDVLDDFLWQNDPEATSTVRPEDDPLARSHFAFPPLTRAISDAHLKRLPKVGLFELLPAIGLALNETSKAVAQTLSVPYKTGSYCIVAGPSRSATKYPILLSGPQMGFSTPSIVHEMSIDAPGLQVSGMDVPGVPGVAIGTTPKFAWGLTSGVAPTDDIFYFKADGPAGYLYGDRRKPLLSIARTLKIKGRSDETVVQKRTEFGPVLISSQSGYIFARRSAYWMHEADSLDVLLSLPAARSAAEIESTMERASVSFNAFYATTSGDIGWRYLGHVPVRAAGLDPRFPTPGEPMYDWHGTIPQNLMPHQRNPKSGLIVNWNNKPAAWWPNLDTPVWGKIFRNSAILGQLQSPTLTVQQVELAPWAIARTDESFPYFEQAFKAAARSFVAGPDNGIASNLALAFEGRTIDGSQGASIFRAWMTALREELFVGTVGSFVSPDLFQTAAQPTLMLRALQGKTVVDYLQGRKASAVAAQAFRTAIERLSSSAGPNPADWRYAAASIRIRDETPIPYSNRGTYIQIVELTPKVVARNVVLPGESESGGHSHDQSPLARAWLYKIMWTGFGG